MSSQLKRWDGSDNHDTVYLMTWFLIRSDKQIAQILNRSENSIKKRLSKLKLSRKILKVSESVTIWDIPVRKTQKNVPEKTEKQIRKIDPISIEDKILNKKALKLTKRTTIYVPIGTSIEQANVIYKQKYNRLPV